MWQILTILNNNVTIKMHSLICHLNLFSDACNSEWRAGSKRLQRKSMKSGLWIYSFGLFRDFGVKQTSFGHQTNQIDYISVNYTKKERLQDLFPAVTTSLIPFTVQVMTTMSSDAYAGDGLPLFVCEACWQLISMFHWFKEVYRVTRATLQRCNVDGTAPPPPLNLVDVVKMKITLR